MMLWMAGAALAGDGQLVLGWKGGLGALRLEAPAGEHLAPDAPTRVAVTTPAGEYVVDWGDLALGVALPVGGGGVVQGTASYSLCADGGTACRVVEAPFSGLVEGRRGQVRLAWIEVVGGVDTDAQAAAAQGHDLSIDAAFARSAQTGQPVLLDFGAVWCPPCQVMAAEVFDAPEHAAALAPFVFVAIDADHPDSWVVKDRYAVGGYPTVLVAGPDGAEIGRHVGYSTAGEFLGWLSAQRGPGLDARLAERDGLDDAGRGALALALLASDRADDAASLLEGTAGVDATLARFALDPQPGAVAGLIVAAPDRWNQWIWDAFRLPLDASTTAALRSLVASQAAVADVGDAAALAYVAGQLAEDPADARAFAALAGQLVAGQQTGDPTHDRGFWLDQASFLEDAGRTDAGVVVLQQGQRAWPHEFTWPYTIAGQLQRADRPADALPYAQAALALAYGDQVLRAAHRLAQLLEALGRTDEALAVIADALERTDRPQAGTDVRTFRYLTALETLHAELSAP